MTLRITNYCDMGCMHCMQNSNTYGKHMSLETFNNSIKFAKLFKDLNTIQVSGGEPTEHPNILYILKTLLIEFNFPITLITNGEKLNDKSFRKEIFKLLKTHPNFLFQITNIKGIYRKFESTQKLVKKINKKLLKNHLGSRFSYSEDLSYGIIPIGRAKKNMDKLKELGFEKAPRKSSSCFNMYSSLQGTGNLVDAINYIKTHSIATFCKPMITEIGHVKFGEYEACTSIFNIDEIDLDKDIDLILDDIYGPCKECCDQNQSTLLDTYITKFKNIDIIDADIIEPINDTPLITKKD